MENRLKVLDVGSGMHPLANAIHVDINKKVPNLNVICDAQFLPFQDDTFRVVYASHLLEHVKCPFATLEEFKRVAKKSVVIRTPHASRALASEDPTHIYSWNANTFKQLLECVFPNVQVNQRVGRGSNNLETVKILFLAFFFGRHIELVAVCKKS